MRLHKADLWDNVFLIGQKDFSVFKLCENRETMLGVSRFAVNNIKVKFSIEVLKMATDN